MREPEVSLGIAFYYITKNLTNQDVFVSLDGAHIKIKDNILFSVKGFMNEHGFYKTDGNTEHWQGEYKNKNFTSRIQLSAKTGIGDVRVILTDGTELYVESKKSGTGKGNPEYPLMREAIGQLMTAKNIGSTTTPAIAVPYSNKTFNLAKEWAGYEQIKMAKIRFILVHEDGDLTII